MKGSVFFIIVLTLIASMALSMHVQVYPEVEKYLFDDSETPLPVIWFHADDIEDIISVEQLIKSYEKQGIVANFYMTTSNIETKLLADNLIDRQVHVVLNNSLDQTMNIFKKIKPRAIVLIRQEVVWSALMTLAHLLQIPTFLVNGEYHKQIERLLENDRYIHVPIFNTLMHIYAPSNNNLEAFTIAGIKKPSKFLCGNTQTFNKLNKKKEFLLKLGTSAYELKQQFPYPVLLVSPIHKQSIDQFLLLYMQAKQRHPNLKLILTIDNVKSLEKDLSDLIGKMDYSYFILHDSTLINQKDSAEKMQLIQLIFNNNDIIVTFSLNNTFLFFLQSITTIHFVDGTLCNINVNHFLDSAAWENPIIVSNIARKITADTKKSDLNAAFAFEGDLEKEIIIIQVQDEKDLMSKTLLLLDDDELRKTMGRHSVNGLKKMSSYVAKTLEPLFEAIKKICQR